MSDDSAQDHAEDHAELQTRDAPPMFSPAAFDMVATLLKICSDPKATIARFRDLRAAQAAAEAAEAKLAEGEAKLAVAQAALAEGEAKVRAYADAEAAKWVKRRADLDREKGLLDFRAQQVGALEAAWRDYAEPAEVMRGWKSPELSALEKARRAHAGKSSAAAEFDPHFPARPLDPHFKVPPDVTLTRDAE